MQHPKMYTRDLFYELCNSKQAITRLGSYGMRVFQKTIVDRQLIRAAINIEFIYQISCFRQRPARV